jgi:hypothetical protein
MKIILLSALIVVLTCHTIVNHKFKQPNFGPVSIPNFGWNGGNAFGISPSNNVLDTILKKTSNVFTMQKSELESIQI